MKDRLQKIIEDMTLSEKLGQLLQVNTALLYQSSAELTGEALHLNLSEENKKTVGSVLNFSPCEREEIQSATVENSRLKIPLLFMMDVIHGCETIFPIPLAMGCTFDEGVVEECVEMSAREALAAGIDVTFSPMVDLVRDCRWGRVMESTGEDHYLNGEMGKAFIRGYHKGGLACCVKHLAAYGAAECGRDYNTTDVSQYALQEYYYHAYRECMKENPEMVMSSFNCLNGKPVNGRKEILVDLLRGEWGFDGVLISDYDAVAEMILHGFAQDEKACADIAAKSEIDIEMMSSTYVKHIPTLIEEGKITIEQIDKMLYRVLALKEKVGLFERKNGKVDKELYQKLVRSKEHLAIAQKGAEKSFVLLKNEGVLPLTKAQKVALIGPFADTGNMLGNWFAYGKTERTQSVKSAWEEICGELYAYAKGCDWELLSTEKNGFADALQAAKGADVLVVCIGESSWDSGEGKSRANPCVPTVQVELVRELKKTGKPVVGVIFGGRPLILTEIEPELDGILYVWQPGSSGGKAIVRTLYGENNPSGKTTMSFPRSVGQCPIYYNEFHGGRRKLVDDLRHSSYRSGFIDELNAPLYPFGYGLSYTQFELSEMQLSKTNIKAGEKLVASIFVKNVGDCTGEEVVQLYIRDKVSSLVRPIQELKGYQKVSLMAGEQKRVEFVIDERQLSYHDESGKVVIEQGAFEIMIGNSSRQVCVQGIEYIG